MVNGVNIGRSAFSVFFHNGFICVNICTSSLDYETFLCKYSHVK